MRVIALIDGEHHPPVTRDALDGLAEQHDLRGVLFVGGEEKVDAAVLERPEDHYGRPVEPAYDDRAEALRRLARKHDAELVMDLSGEPVLGPADRMEVVCVALDEGLRYEAPGFEVAPPPFTRLPFEGPVLSVIGTGKRTGKTAFGGHWASLLSERAAPVVVSMGRGGPPDPEVVHAGRAPDLPRLLEMARAGGHAASDFLEDAVLAGVATIGCRRCGEGPAGETFDSNVLAGARLALSLDPDVILLEGSGAALPPIEADATLCVTSAPRAGTDALSHLGPYRLLRSDVVAVLGADEVSRSELDELKRRLGRWCDPDRIVGCVLEPEPASDVPGGARAAFFCTAPAHAEQALTQKLAEKGIELCVFSSALARRAELRRDLERAAREGCDLYLTELKAAAIEVVAEEADRLGVPLVVVRNRPLSVAGEREIDAVLLELADEAGERARARSGSGRERAGEPA